MRIFVFILAYFFSATMLNAQPFNNEWIDHAKTYYKFRIGKTGLYHINQNDLAAQGLSATPAEQFQLWRNGKEVPLFTSIPVGILPPGGYIEFHGEKNDGVADKILYKKSSFQLSDKYSLETDTAAYFLTVNTSANNLRFINTPNDAAGSNLSPLTSFIYTKRFDFNNQIHMGKAINYGENVYSSSYDEGEGFSSPYISLLNPFSFSASQLHMDLSGSPAKFSIGMAGSSQLGYARKIQCIVNGQAVIEKPLGAFNATTFSTDIPLSIFSGDAMNVVIKNSPDTFDRIVTSFAELKYPRQFNFDNASEFEFELPAANSKTLISISNFNNGDVAPVLFDLTNNLRYTAIIENGNFKIVLQPSSSSRKLIFENVSVANTMTVSGMVKKIFTDFSLIANQGDYLIISNPVLISGGTAVEQYRAYRNSAAGGNFNAKIFAINELADEFTFGIKNHPLSIKNFLAFARKQFSIKPKFCFLLGKAVSYPEYRQNENNISADLLNLVPSYGWPASDILLAADGYDPIATTPIGRLSVINNEEILTYLMKVKAYEAQQANTTQTVSNKAWMKNIVFVAGANSPSLDGLFSGYFNGYQSKIQDSLFGASVTIFSNLTTGPPTPATNQLMQKKFAEGISLVNYFGHSNALTLDYNLDDPAAFNNAGKYPVFLVNGCNAGNIYSFDPSRLQSVSSLAEKFVLAPNAGAIAFIGNSHFGITNYLDAFNTGFYQSLQKNDYGEAVAININAGAKYLSTQPFLDSTTRYLQAEETILNGDPAIRINTHLKTDFAVEETDISIDPSVISVAEDSFTVKIFLHNLGRYQGDSVGVTIQRQSSVSNEIILDSAIKTFGFIDSLSLKLPVGGLLNKGENKLLVTIDKKNIYNELSESNNTVSKIFQVLDNAVIPVYPFDLSIVANAVSKFYASTADPFATAKTYYFELDSTALFNSPIKYAGSLNSLGGLLEFTGPSLVENLVYYWRVGVTEAGVTNWRQSSFIYVKNTEGFNQSHLFQHLQSKTDKIELQNGEWIFTDRPAELSVSMAVYPTSGTVDTHFSISVNGEYSTKSACLGHSVIVNVFDPKTLQPLYNQTVPAVIKSVSGGGFMGSAGICAESRATNFEFSIMTEQNRQLVKNFIDWIPAGYYFVVRNINDPNVNVPYAPEWKSDQLVFGAGNTLYDVLKKQGFADLDNYNYNRVFGFISKKNDAAFKPVSKFSDGIYDLKILKTIVTVKDTSGFVMSPKVGPALNWQQFNWAGTGIDAYNSNNVGVEIFGIDKNGNASLLNKITAVNSSADLSAISAKQYPWLSLKMTTHDGFNFKPYQLKNLQVIYNPVPEGALAPAIKFIFKDTVETGEPLQIGIPFKNISTSKFDSVLVKYSITDKNNKLHEFAPLKTKPIVQNDTAWVNTTIDTKDLAGNNMVYLDVNPQLAQPEKTHENNFFYRKLFVQPDNIKPLLDITFDGMHIMNNDIVSAKPSIRIELKDESKFLLLNDTALVTIQLMRPGQALQVLKYGADSLTFVPPASSNNTAVINYHPALLADGDYQLVVKAKDKTGNAVSDNEYKSIFRVYNRPMISDLFNYPNPFTTSTAFVFTVTGSRLPQNFRIQVMTITGKIVKEITAAELGPIHIGKNISSYKWDGKDEYGQQLANGVYLYRVITNLDNNSLDHFDLRDEQGDIINTQKFFNKGYGKMYLLR